MAETTKDAAKISAMGLAFGNPLTASEAMAPLITAAQAYMVGDGLNDAKQRINENLTTKKSKTDQAGDALMVGLDLLGAYPALRSINSGWQQIAPELEKGWSVTGDYIKNAASDVAKARKAPIATGSVARVVAAPESYRSGFTSFKVPGNDPSNTKPAEEILRKVEAGEITSLDEAAKQLKEAYPFSFIPENFIKNMMRYGTRGFLPGNGGAEVLRMGARETKTTPGALVSEFYKTDVYPRAKNTFLAGVTDINPGYDEMVYAYYPSDIGGSYFPYQRKIGIKSNTLNNSDNSTKVHEMNHALRKGGASEYKYTDKERSLLKRVDTPSLHYDFPNIDHNLEINATLTELRFKYWQELKKQLNRTPTTEELNTYIDNLYSDTIRQDLENINSYGKSLVHGYYGNEDHSFRRVKDAMKYVAGVTAPAIIVNKNDTIPSNSK